MYPPGVVWQDSNAGYPLYWTTVEKDDPDDENDEDVDDVNQKGGNFTVIHVWIHNLYILTHWEATTRSFRKIRGWCCSAHVLFQTCRYLKVWAGCAVSELNEMLKGSELYENKNNIFKVAKQMKWRKKSTLNIKH